MTEPENPSLFTRADGLRLAYRLRHGAGPTLVFLPGYMSDMEGTKALALDQWAARQGRAMLRFDYSGCGASEGEFERGTLAIWRDDALALIDHLIEGPILLVGSSMGGWLALLIALARPARITGLIGIAAAPDFTQWGVSEAGKARILARERSATPSEYSDQPLVMTRAFWESGQALRLLEAPIAIDCPVRLLQGQCDPDVPWQIAVRLAEALQGSDVQLLLLKDGDHRLSRERDIAALIALIEQWR